MKRIISIFAASVLFAGLCAAIALNWEYVIRAAEDIKTQMTEIFLGNPISEEENEAAEKPNIINSGIYDFDTFNPLITQSQSVKEAMQLVYEPLYVLDGEMRPVPVLASDYSKSADGRTIILNIKQNVMWHDGTNLTAEDVAYTFKVIRSGQTNYTENLTHVADYMMIDDYSIKITLSSPVPVFEAMLTFPIVQRRTDMSVNQNYIPNGTGPFCYGTKTRVDEIYFGAFENYHEGRCQIDAMYMHVANSREKYMTMLEASEIDFSSSEIVDLMEYMPKGSLSLFDYPDNKMVYLGFNMASPIFNGNATRAGIAKLIDKKKIVNSVIFSRGVASDIPINPSSYLYYGANSGFEADELSANDNLGNDGWGADLDGHFVRMFNGSEQELEFEILVNADSFEQGKVAESIAEQLNRFGILSSVSALPYDEYKSRVERREYDAFLGEADIYGNMELTPLTNPAANCFAYNNPELSTINAQMGMTNDEEELKALFKQYSETVVADMPFAVIYYKKGSFITSANVKSGIDPSYVWLYRNCAQWSVKE